LLQLAELRNRNDTRYLSSAEFEYALCDETDYSYPGSELENRLATRANEDLIIRLQRLLNDISVLHRGGYLDPDYEYWAETADIQTHIKSLTDKKTSLSVRELEAASVNFGHQVGLALAMVFGFAQEQELAADFLWGIILANCATESGDLDEEKENIEFLLNHLQQWSESYYNGRLSYDSQDAENIVHPVLNEFGFKYSEHLETRIRGVLPYQMDDGEDISKKEAVRQIYKDLLENSSLEKVRQLREMLEEEWDEIEKAAPSGVSAAEIFQAVHKEKQASSENIAEKLYHSTFKGQVTETLNKLAEEGKNRQASVIPVYQHAPIVEWDSVNGEWSTTEYGTLVYKYDVKDNLNWLHDYGDSPEIGNEPPGVDPEIPDEFSEANSESNNELPFRSFNKKEWELLQYVTTEVIE